MTPWTCVTLLKLYFFHVSFVSSFAEEASRRRMSVCEMTHECTPPIVCSVAQHPRKGRVYKIRGDFGKSTDGDVVQGESVRLESESPSIRRDREPLEKISLSRVHPETTVRCVFSSN